MFKFSQQIHEQRLISKSSAWHQHALLTLKTKKKAKIAFFVIHGSVWKYDQLFQLLKDDPSFEPIIIICPYTVYGENVMIETMDDAYNLFKEKNYTVLKTYNKETKEWINIKNTIQPDAIFFTNPYRLTKDEFYITNWLHTITYYVPYSFMITDRPKMQYDELLHNLCYRIFYETNFQDEAAKKHARNKGKNGISTGYPGLDELLFPQKQPLDFKNPWKAQEKELIKVIWAPHHSIENDDEGFSYSNFLTYAEIFKNLLTTYRRYIQIAFKPHPILKPKLYAEPSWGIKRTDEYYDFWEQAPNGQLEEGNYIDLFLTSDALIHDSGSFLTEYICTNKPSLFMIKSSKLLEGFTDLGQKIISCHYQSHDIEELHTFIEEVLIKGQDKISSQRASLIREYLLPPEGNTASYNIYKQLKTISNSGQ